MIDILFYWVYQILKGPERRGNVKYMLSIDKKMWAALNMSKYRENSIGHISTEFIEIGFEIDRSVTKYPETPVRSIVVKLNILSVDLEDPLMDINCLEDMINRGMHEELKQITSNSDSSVDEDYRKMRKNFQPFIKEIPKMKLTVLDDQWVSPIHFNYDEAEKRMLAEMQSIRSPYIPMSRPLNPSSGHVVYNGPAGAPLSGVHMSEVADCGACRCRRPPAPSSCAASS